MVMLLSGAVGDVAVVTLSTAILEPQRGSQRLSQRGIFAATGGGGKTPVKTPLGRLVAKPGNDA